MLLSLSRWTTGANILKVVCFFTLSGILVAGLWPFHAPANQVSWVDAGLRFGRYGVVLGTGKLAGSRTSNENSFSLGVWIVPGFASDSSTVLAFDAPERPRRFSLLQSSSDLELLSENSGSETLNNDARLYVPDVFRKGRPVFVTVTAGRGQTVVYIDGTPAQRTSKFPLSAEDLTGEVVVGTSPVQNDSWTGDLRGLEIYGRELNPTEVSRNFEGCIEHGRPDVGKDRSNLALYLFREGGGNRVRDQARSGVDLYIPEKFIIPHEKLLEAPWKEYHSGWSYWTNILINIGGFVPLGFFVLACFGPEPGARRAAVLTIAFCGAVSLTIEILPGFLPTRDSGLTDIITNTLGGALGVMLYSLTPAGRFLDWLLLMLAPAASDRLRQFATSCD
jgi:hypothetical protein